MYFYYSTTETEYLKQRDNQMAFIIEHIGFIKRPVINDLFECIIHKIIGQQISGAAQKTVFSRLKQMAGDITAVNLDKFTVGQLQECGMTFRKASYISDFTKKVLNKEINPENIKNMSDEDAIAELVKIKGIGRWTAEMTLISCLQRKNILSYGDLAIHKGLRMIYGVDNITPEFFEKIRDNFSPYCTVASFYIWRIAGGAMPELKDPKTIK